MEISMLQMWFFFTLLPNLSSPIGFFSVLLGIVLFCFSIFFLICVVCKAMETQEKEIERANNVVKAILKPFKIIIVVFLFLFTIQISVPTTKQMAAILIVPAITQNQTLQTLGSEMGDTLTMYFKEWAKELQEEISPPSPSSPKKEEKL